MKATGATLRAAAAIGEAIRDLGRAPLGHLYAVVMGHLTLDQFTRIVGVLECAGLIRVCDNVATWTGPVEQPKEVA